MVREGLVGVWGRTIGKVATVEGVVGLEGGRHSLLMGRLLPLGRRALLLKVPGAGVKGLVGVGIGEQVIKRVQLGPGEHVALLASVVVIEMHVIGGGHGGRVRSGSGSESEALQ